MLNKNTVDAVEDTVGTALLKALLMELQMLSPRYRTMGEPQQAEIIDRLRGQIADQLHDAVSAIATRSFDYVPCTITSVGFKDEIKITLEVPRTSEGAHAAADAIGGQCMLVLASMELFTGGMGTVKPRPAQEDWTDPAP